MNAAMINRGVEYLNNHRYTNDALRLQIASAEEWLSRAVAWLSDDEIADERAEISRMRTELASRTA